MRIPYLLASLALSLPAQASPKSQCQWESPDAAAMLARCRIELPQPKNAYLLQFRGELAETAYWHGKLLGNEIHHGVIPAVARELERALASTPQPRRALYQSLLGCMIKNYRGSVPQDFLALHENLARGIRDSGAAPLASELLFQGSMASELLVFSEGMEQKLRTAPLQTISELIGACGLSPLGLRSEDLASFSRTLGRTLKMGCSSIAAADSYTENGRMLVGRNFDSHLLGTYDQWPVVVMHTPPSGYSSVAVASAGVHFAGGITGFNEAGLVATLHEIQSDDYRMRTDPGMGMPAPMLVQGILENAATIDEALAYAKQFQHFGAWSVFLADTRRHESASLEITGHHIAATPTTKGIHAQTNHFQSPAMGPFNFHAGFGRQLDTEGRLQYLRQTLEQEKGQWNVAGFIRMLASHWDPYTGLRSFGRTVAKASGTQSFIADPEGNRLLFTLADTYPVQQGTWMELGVDFAAARRGEAAFSMEGFHTAPPASPQAHWNRSLDHYIRAGMAFRGQDGAGGSGNLAALAELTQAQRAAAQDGISEFPYQLMRARLSILISAQSLQQGLAGAAAEYLVDARDALQEILSQSETRPGHLHAFDLSLAHLWRARVSDLSQDRRVRGLLKDKSFPPRDIEYGKALELHRALLRKGGDTAALQALVDEYTRRGHASFPKWGFSDATASEPDFTHVE